jgi:hypothetical protein
VSCALFTTAAVAAEICVKCTGPDANYDCVVNKSGPVDTVTKLYCITALAKAGPHASCSIDRNTTAPCQGERREYTIPAGLDGALGGGAPQQEANAPATNSPTANAPVIPPSATVPPNNAAGTSPDQQPPQTTSDTPPKTVQEMMEKSDTSKSAGNAAKSATTALQKAGSAVGSAAKTSWKCLSSFFSKC